MALRKNPLFDAVHAALQRKRELAIFVAGIAATAVFAVGYTFYRQGRNESAHRALVETMAYFDAPITPGAPHVVGGKPVFGSVDEKWQATADALERAYINYADTRLSPYFLALKAEALDMLGKNKQAAETLERATSLMAQGPLRDSFRIKLSQTKLDGDDAALRAEGLAFLEKFARQDENPLHDHALYALGEYHWAQGNFDQVRSFWGMLNLKYGKATENPSVFVGEISNRLELLESSQA